MTCSAARMRLRLLAAAPVMVLGSLCWHAGGAAGALLLWMGFSAILSCGGRYPYPRKRYIRLHQLFFCYALTVFITGGMTETIRRFFMNGLPSLFTDLLIDTGAVGFALPIGKRALSLPLSQKVSCGLGALLCAIFAILLCS